MESLPDCNSTPSLPSHVPASSRTREDRRMEPCHRTRRGHRVRQVGRRLEARHPSGGGDSHRHHPQLPHGDFPRVEGGQGLFQRLGSGGLQRHEVGVAWQGGLCRKELEAPAQSQWVWMVVEDQEWCVFISSLQPLTPLVPLWKLFPVRSVVCLHAQSQLDVKPDFS